MQQIAVTNMIQMKNERPTLEIANSKGGSNENKNQEEDRLDKNKNCSFFRYGNLKISQKEKICSYCDIYGIYIMCQSCFEHCHKDCAKIKRQEIQSIREGQKMKSVKLTKTQSQLDSINKIYKGDGSTIVTPNKSYSESKKTPSLVKKMSKFNNLTIEESTIKRSTKETRSSLITSQREKSIDIVSSPMDKIEETQNEDENEKNYNNHINEEKQKRLEFSSLKSKIFNFIVDNDIDSNSDNLNFNSNNPEDEENIDDEYNFNFINDYWENPESDKISYISKKKITKQKKEAEFVCNCGKILKHKPRESTNKPEINFCTLSVEISDSARSLSDSLKNSNLDNAEKIKRVKNGLKWNQVKEGICRVCKEYCDDPESSRQSIDINKIRGSFKCKCKNLNHNMNDILINFLLKIEENEVPYLNDYKIFRSPKSKILNEILNNTTFCMTNYIMFLKKSMEQLETIENHYEDLKRYTELISPLYEIIYNHNNKIYFFNADIRSLFEHEKCFKLVRNCHFIRNTGSNQNKSGKDIILSRILLIRNLIGINFIINIKKDFESVKLLKTKDFSCASIETRFYIRDKLLNDISVPYSEIRKKYLSDNPISNSQDSNSVNSVSLKIVSKDLMKILIETIKNTEVFLMTEQVTLYEVCLRIINFSLKIMIFSKKDLEELTNDLFLFVINFSKEYFSSPNNPGENIELCYYIWKYILKICYFTAILYNDIHTEQIVKEYNNPLKKSLLDKEGFIHMNESVGNTLIKILIRSLEFISQVRMHHKPIDRKIIHITSDLLRLFCLDDNFYSDQLKKYEGLKSLTIDAQYILNTDIKNILKEINKNIEENYYLDSNPESNNPNNIKFGFELLLFKLIKYDEVKIMKQSKQDEIPINNQFCIYRNKVIKFILSRLNLDVSLIKYYHSLFGKVEFSTELNSILINEMIDEICSKFIKSMKIDSISIEDLTPIFGIYLLYCLSSETVNMLCIGRNLTVISRLFSDCVNSSNHSKIELSLDFLILLLNGIKLFKKDISKENLIEEFVNNSKNIVVKFSKGTITLQRKIIKFFLILESYMGFEDYMKSHMNVLYQYNQNMKLQNFGKSKSTFTFEDQLKGDEDYINSKLLNTNKSYIEEKPISNKEIQVINLNINSEKDKLIENEESKQNNNKSSNENPVSLLSENRKPSLIRRPIKEELKYLFKFMEFTIKNNDYLYSVDKYFDIKFLEEILKMNQITLKQRTILLNFITQGYFPEIIDQEGKNISTEQSEPSEKDLIFFQDEYLQLYLDDLIQYVDKSNMVESFHLVTNKNFYDYTHKITEFTEGIGFKCILLENKILFLNYFLNELDMFDTIISSQKFYIWDIENYIIQILNCVKMITDFVSNKKLLDQMTFYLYKIATKFISKSRIFKNILVNIKTRGEVGEINKLDLVNIDHLKKSDFDQLNKERISDEIFLHLEEIYKTIHLDNQSYLKRFIKDLDEKFQRDFRSNSLIKFKEFSELYTSNETPPNNNNNLTKYLSDTYDDSFINFNQSCFSQAINLIKIKPTAVDLNEKFIDHFISLLLNGEKNPEIPGIDGYNYQNMLITNMRIVNKLLFYETEATQLIFENLNSKLFIINSDRKEENINDVKENLIKIFYHRLESIINDNFSQFLYYNFQPKYIEINETNIVIIKFLTLIAENYNKTFREKVFYFYPNEKNTIFDLIKMQILEILRLTGFKSKIRSQNFVNRDFLIVNFCKLVNFMMEYIEGTDNIHDISNQLFEELLNCNIENVLFSRPNQQIENFSQMNPTDCSYKLISKMKEKIVALLIFIFKNKIENNLFKQFRKQLPLTSLFEEIQYYLEILLKKFVPTPKAEDYSCENLISLYMSKIEFNQSSEIEYCSNLFILIKIISDTFKDSTIENHFNKFIGSYDPESYLKIDSPNAPKIYEFMNRIIKTVEVVDIDNNLSSKDTNINNNTQIIEQNPNSRFDNIQNCFYTKVFFQKPAVTFYLIDPIKRKFMEKVNRESRSSKLNSLIGKIDSFIVNSFYYSMFTPIGQFLNEYLDMFYLEIINYIFLVVHQIILLTDFYKSTNLADEKYVFTIEEKYSIPKGNFILALIQIAFITIILFLWFILQFPIFKFQNILSEVKIESMFKRDHPERVKFFEKINENLKSQHSFRYLKFIEIFNDSFKVSFWTKFRVSLVDCILLNRTVNTFVFTLIFVIIYLITKSSILIVFPLLFLFNLVPILLGMMVALKRKANSFLMMLIFTFLFIYFYMWLSFYFIYPLFNYDNIYIEGQGPSNSENFCVSAIQCFLVMMDVGLRSGGGIGDQLPNVSWKYDTNFYIINFFYKFSFYIIVILILSNSCFGIIIDAFSEMRELNYLIEKDKNDVCFICGIHRDSLINKNVNFDLHRSKVHDPWDYVDFIIFLCLNDPDYFGETEYFVWKKISNSPEDISWIPGEKEANE